MERKLTTIVAADIAGFSRLVARDEEGTLAAQRAHRRALVDPLLAKHQGRLANTAGDSLLLEFASTVEAVRFAISLQTGMAARNAEIEKDDRIVYRVGINVGDVVIEGEDLLGDGVNVAARLEALCPPGGIVVSRAVRDQVRDRLDTLFADLGPQRIKNLPRPVRAFQVLRDGETAIRPPRPARRRVRATATLVIAALVAGGVAWFLQRPDFVAADPARLAFPLTSKPSIAVLPFTNASESTDQDFFAEGLTEDIVVDLSKVSGIFVVASISTEGYANRPTNIGRVAENLGVRFVLTGSVRRDGAKLRVTASLADALAGEQVWAERYDREIAEVFAVQSEITREVVKALEVTLKAPEEDRIFQKYAANIDAYSAFLQARKIVAVPSRSNIDAGEKLFRKAIELDPGFAAAYAGLSFNYSVKVRFAFSEDPGRDTKRSLELAEKAIEIDPNLAWSHIALAGARLASGDADGAVDAVREAVVIQPNGYEANLFMGFYLTFADRAEDAIGYIETANELSRTETTRGLAFLGMAQFAAGHYEACAKAWSRRFEHLGVPKSPIGHVFLAACQQLSGQGERAAASAQRMRRTLPDFHLSKWPWLQNYNLPRQKALLSDAAIASGIPE